MSASHAPHNRMIRPAVSPSDPPVLPSTRSGSAVGVWSNFIRLSGVALVTTSGALGVMNGSAKLSPRSAHHEPPGAGQVVIAAGNAACRNARPSSAGLKMFWPSPPKTSLPRPIATAPPSSAIQSGMPAGSVRPSSSPVMAAEPSRSVPPGPNARSVATAPKVAAASTSSALGPKNQVAAATTGARLITTDHMMRAVESSALRCGDGLMCSSTAVMRPSASGAAPPCRARTSAIAGCSTDRRTSTSRTACSRRGGRPACPRSGRPARAVPASTG